jgi:hypothetical protein
MARTRFGQKAYTRSASGDAWIPLKGALCFIPVFVAFWSPSTIELRAGAGNFERAPFHKSAVDWLLSRLSLRLLAVFDHHLQGRSNIIFQIENLKYRQCTYSILAKVDRLFYPPTSRHLPPSLSSLYQASKLLSTRLVLP